MRLGTVPAAILLAHEPDFADTSAATGRFDLQLSGHTHGGQIRFPFFGGDPVEPGMTATVPTKVHSALRHLVDLFRIEIIVSGNPLL